MVQDMTLQQIIEMDSFDRGGRLVPTKEEHDIMIRVIREYREFAYSNIRCPRCSNALEYIQSGGSFSIKCRTEKCLETGGRGI